MSAFRLVQPLNRIKRSALRLVHCTRGVAAIEFGMIVPIMLMLFLGSVEFSQAITVDRRVSQVASSTADLVSRQSSLTSAQADGYLQIINQLIAPYDTTKLKITLISVYAKDDVNVVKVCWSKPGPNGGAATYTDGQVYTALNGKGVLTANTSVVVAEVTYAYTPASVSLFLNSQIITMRETFYLKPRLSADVQLDTKKCL